MEMDLIQMFQERGCTKVTMDYSFTYASGLTALFIATQSTNYWRASFERGDFEISRPKA